MLRAYVDHHQEVFTVYVQQLVRVIIIFSGCAAQRGQWLPRRLGFVITHNDAPHSVGFLWTSDQLIATTST
jgi:hypothetical protein